MNNEIVFVCNSVNNKNVRGNELVILRKNEDQKCFEFGENEMNIKKRYYNDLETLNKDFEALLKIKNKEEKIDVEEKANEEIIKAPIEEAKEEINGINDIRLKAKRRYNKKNNSLF